MKYIITFSTLSIVIGFLLLVLFANSITYNPIKYNFPYMKESFSTLPQGWAFFTRSPREGQVMLYKLEDGQITEMNHRHSSPGNAFGLNRKVSHMMSEIQAIERQVPDEKFMNSRWNFQSKQYGEIPEEAYPIEQTLNHPQLNGEYVLVYQEIIPWAWSKNLDKIDMPAKVARIKIEES